jgi:Outer membrane protein beta-barrel domain
MRLPSLAAALLLALATPLAAQAGFEVGIKGGASFGDVSNKGLLPGNLKSRTGFAAGASLATKGLIGLGIEGLFAQRGLKSEVATDELKLNYVDVPVYLRVRIPTPAIKPFAYAGPQVSFEISCKSGTVDCPDGNRKKTTYSGVIGGGVRFGGLTGFTVEGRYVYGLTDLKLGTLTSSDSYKTRSFLILVGLAF